MKIQMSAKCSDLFSCSILDKRDDLLVDGYDGYVPAFMPDEHYGDYVILDIDAETGQILNWKSDALKLVKQFVKEQKKVSNE
jgi:hypothetical protein